MTRFIFIDTLSLLLINLLFFLKLWKKGYQGKDKNKPTYFSFCKLHMFNLQSSYLKKCYFNENRNLMIKTIEELFLRSNQKFCHGFCKRKNKMDEIKPSILVFTCFTLNFHQTDLPALLELSWKMQIHLKYLAWEPSVAQGTLNYSPHAVYPRLIENYDLFSNKSRSTQLRISN